MPVVYRDPSDCLCPEPCLHHPKKGEPKPPPEPCPHQPQEPQEPQEEPPKP